MNLRDRKQHEDGDNFKMGSFRICTLRQLLLGIDIGGAC